MKKLTLVAAILPILLTSCTTKPSFSQNPPTAEFVEKESASPATESTENIVTAESSTEASVETINPEYNIVTSTSPIVSGVVELLDTLSETESTPSADTETDEQQSIAPNTLSEDVPPEGIPLAFMEAPISANITADHTEALTFKIFFKDLATGEDCELSSLFIENDHVYRMNLFILTEGDDFYKNIELYADIDMDPDPVFFIYARDAETKQNFTGVRILSSARNSHESLGLSYKPASAKFTPAAYGTPKSLDITESELFTYESGFEIGDIFNSAEYLDRHLTPPILSLDFVAKPLLTNGNG